MRKLVVRLMFGAAIAANLAFTAQVATAATLAYQAAYDPAQDKWILVCTKCLSGCNCPLPE